MDRAAQADRQTLKNFEEECERVRRAELADERAIAIRERYRRERSAYGFDRLATRVVREARQGFSRRRDALQRLRAFAVGLGLGVFGLAALGAAGLIGPKPEAPVRIWLSTGTETKAHGRAACGDSTVAPSNATTERDGSLLCTGDPVGYSAGSRFPIATTPGEGDPSEQGAVRATLHKALARPQYLGGGRSDQAPPGHAAPTHPAAVSMTPPGGGVAVAASIPSK